jgi:hypothetical protein
MGFEPVRSATGYQFTAAPKKLEELRNRYIRIRRNVSTTK